MKQLKTITVKVQRGYITRMSPILEWEETLVRLPVGYSCVDGDALPYYERRGDGTYREFYEYTVPPERLIYALKDEYDERYEAKDGSK